MLLPNVLVIGAHKGGTTSMWEYLRQHPQVYMSPQKELHFFDREDNWRRGVEWYAQNFAGAGDAVAVGEATPAYTRYPHRVGVVERAAATVPDAKLVYVVRDPVERIRSHWVHEVQHGLESLPFDQAVVDRSVYTDLSRYALQIEQWLRRYAAEQLLVVTSEELLDRRAETMGRVYEFLGVDPSWTPPAEQYHRSDDKRMTRPPLRRMTRRPWARAVLGHVPPALRSRMKHAARPVVNVDVSLDKPEASDTVREVVHERLRGDVARLRAHLPDDFDGWGIA